MSDLETLSQIGWPGALVIIAIAAAFAYVWGQMIRNS